MRRIISVLILSLGLIFVISGCGAKTQEIMPEQQVTMEQVNTEGKYVARAFLEAVFTDNRAMFDKCYPQGFFERMGDNTGEDLYAQYRNIMRINANVNGTASTGYKDYCLANGYDEAAMRSRICLLTGFEYSSIGLIQIQKVTVFFSNGSEKIDTDFYYVVYEINGSWYMLESFREDAGF